MLQHLILTKFSYRFPGWNKGKSIDPLSPSVLVHRMHMLKSITYPCLKSQTHQDFSWIIIIDPGLPDDKRKAIENFQLPGAKIYISEYMEASHKKKTSWLLPFINTDTQYLITSNLDADDAVFRGFTLYIHDYFYSLIKKNKIQPLHFLYAGNIIQWDLIQSKDAPFGYIKPWTRKGTISVSTGYTVCCQFPEVDFIVYSLGHRLPGFLYHENDEQFETNDSIRTILKNARNVIKQVAENADVHWDGEIEKNIHVDYIRSNHQQALVVNHWQNKQFTRLLESEDERIKCDIHHSLKDFDIDWKAVEQFSIYRGKKLKFYYQILKNSVIYSINISRGKPYLLRIKIFLRDFGNTLSNLRK
ncbi:MAG TPA: glycosyltransferase [Saprospiraceae bacterium]|nr:glycosyltransferase [Saprospiraceae bacterium]